MSSFRPAASPYSFCVVASLWGGNKLCFVGVIFFYTLQTHLGKVLAYFEVLRVVTFSKGILPFKGEKTIINEYTAHGIM